MLYVQNPLIYQILTMLLFAILMFAGWGITYKNRDNIYFWRYGIFAAAAFTLIMGLRYDRGYDYAHYMAEMVGYEWAKLDREPLYQLFLTIGDAIGLPYWGYFLILSALIISGVLVVLKRMPEYAVWALPLFYLMYLTAFDNLIRQYAAVPFVFFAYAAYIDNRRIAMWIFLACCALIHSTGILAIAVFAGLLYFDPGKIIKSPWIPTLVYLCLALLMDIAMLDSVADYMMSIAPEGSEIRYYYYLQNADRWFTQQGSLSELNNHTISIFTIVSQLMRNALILYFGHSAIKIDERLHIPYWMFFLSTLIIAIGGDIELFIRISNWLDYFAPFLMGAIMMKIELNNWMRYTIGFIFFAPPLVSWFGHQIVDAPNIKCGFVWDVVRNL